MSDQASEIAVRCRRGTLLILNSVRLTTMDRPYTDFSVCRLTTALPIGYVVDDNNSNHFGTQMIDPIEDLTLSQVARELDRSLEQVRRYVREGKLPARKLGMQWFVNSHDLKTFKQEGGKPSREEVLERARKLRQTIERRVGKIDVIELLDRTREDEP